ncbi:MAG: UDP-N-acetylmuramoyl-tripeptide--D-alanyl-D-alanine ligase [Marivirga sp.]|jgi:UDP-N-acetylmuramoyl-tripeptide--D-alanyl-D-alanine ligase
MKIENLYEIYQASTGVCTDTRRIAQGNLFFALKGPNFNGNAFAQKALNQGATVVVLDEQIEGLKEAQCIVVADALAALQELAAYHRSQLKIPVIGITGSNGKTTTKELMQLALSVKYKTYATKGNLNNHIGVPLSVLEIDESYEMAIIEMGANHMGEIASYCAIAQPDFGLITNIGKAHIGEFGGFENIIIGKSELFDFIRKNKGKVFINTNDAVLNNMKKRFADALSYPNEGDYLEASIAPSSFHLKMIIENSIEVSTKLFGQYNFNNVGAALCVAKYFEVDIREAAEAIAAYEPDNMRSQLIETSKYTIILDAYNANPDSMQLAIESLCSSAKSASVTILGDMLELGEMSVIEHEKLAELAVDLGVSRRIYFGEQIQKAMNVDPFGTFFLNKEVLIRHLKEQPIKSGSTVLIKGSRKNALEDLITVLVEND